jgi:hypothetical protein
MFSNIMLSRFKRRARLMEHGRAGEYIRLIVVLCAGILFLSAFSVVTNAWAGVCINYYYEALIDVDNDPGTGGTVHVVQLGSSKDIPGIDYRVRALASITPATKEVHEIDIERWNGSSFVLDSSTGTPGNNKYPPEAAESPKQKLLSDTS